MRGQLIERGAEKYLLRVYLGRDAKGKRQYASKMFYGKPLAAQRALDAMQAQASAKAITRPTERTFEAFVEEWFAFKVNLAVGTKRQYRDTIQRYLTPLFGPRRLHTITTTMIQQGVTQWVRQGLSPRSVQLIFAILHQILEQAVNLGILVRNPADKVVTPELPSREFTILSIEQTLELFRCTANDKHHALWVLLLTTGLRPGEALALKWSDLNGNRLTINRTLSDKSHLIVENRAKTEGSLRTIPLSQLALDALTAHRVRQNRDILAMGPHYERNDFVFAGKTGRFYNLSALRKSWKAALRKCGYPANVRLYDTRHSHATALLNEGVNLAAIANRLGHSSTRITEAVYARIMPKAQDEVVRIYDERLRAVSN